MKSLVAVLGLFLSVLITPADVTAQSSSDDVWNEKLSRASQLAIARKLPEATAAARELLAYSETNLSSDDDRMIKAQLMLSSLLIQQGVLEEADELATKAQQSRESAIQKLQSQAATTLKFRGNILMMQGKLEQAQVVLERAVEYSESAVGADDQETAKHLGNLGALFLKMKEYDKAGELLRRTLKIWENGTPHPVYAVTTMTNLAELHLIKGEQEKARALYEKAKSIQEESFGMENPRLSNFLKNYSGFLRRIGESQSAEAVELRLKKINGN